MKERKEERESERVWEWERTNGEIETREKYKKESNRTNGPVEFDVRLSRDAGEKKKKSIAERQATRITIENGRYHKCHYPSNPSATESMRNKERRTMNLGQSCLTEKIGLFWSALRFHTTLFSDAISRPRAIQLLATVSPRDNFVFTLSDVSTLMCW